MGMRGDDVEQPKTDQVEPQGQAVQWDPPRRTGVVVDTIPMQGDEWSRVRSDGWQERLDLPGFYQREAVPGLTKPCVLVIRSRDLEPVQPAPEQKATAGLREDAAAALATLREILAKGLIGAQKDLAISLERTLLGIQAAVEQG